METIITWVKSGLLFGIHGSLVIMLSPNKSYEKHISFIVGILFVLVMIHPVMELLSVDGSTYLHSIENYLALDSGMLEVSESDRTLYGQAMELQLKAVFLEAGYQVSRVGVTLKEDGTVSEVTICFGDQVEQLSQLEQYLHSLFGGEVIISYEVE